MDFISIRPADAGLELLQDEHVVDAVNVGRVTRLAAFKRDLVTSDCVCLRFDRSDGDSITIHEEMPGFVELFPLLSAWFAGLDPNWYALVMLPAFRANEMTIWRDA